MKGPQIFIFFQSSKRCEKSETPHINKESSSMSLLMFFTESFHLVVAEINIYYQRQLDGQDGSSHWLPGITLLTWWLLLPYICRWDTHWKTR